MPDQFALTNEQRAWALCLLAEIMDDLDPDKLVRMGRASLPDVGEENLGRNLRIIKRLREEDPQAGYDTTLEYVASVMKGHAYVPRHLAQT